MAATTRLQESLFWSEIRNSNSGAREKNIFPMGSHDYQFLLHSYTKAAVFQELLPIIKTYCALQLRRAAIDRLKTLFYLK